MRTRAILALSLLLPLSALACGFCIEDRVAAVYDQTAVEKAVKAKRHVAFFGIETETATAQAVAASLERGGAVRGSAKVAAAEHACSIVYDPARTSLAKLTQSAARSGIVLTALRIIDEGGKLREP